MWCLFSFLFSFSYTCRVILLREEKNSVVEKSLNHRVHKIQCKLNWKQHNTVTLTICTFSNYTWIGTLKFRLVNHFTSQYYCIKYVIQYISTQNGWCLAQNRPVIHKCNSNTLLVLRYYPIFSIKAFFPWKTDLQKGIQRSTHNSSIYMTLPISEMKPNVFR